MTLKRYVLDQHRLTADVAHIDGNYVTDGMLPLLVAHGLDVTLPTFVIWEGNTMYLEAAADRAVLTQLRKQLAHVRVAFDYFVPAVIARTTGDPAMTRMADNFAAMNAPWITAFDDIRELAAEVGMDVLEDVTTAALSRIYRPLNATPVFGPFYAIATLGSR